MSSLSIVVLDGCALNPGDLSWDVLNQLGRVTIYDYTPQHLVSQRAASAEVVLTNKTPLTQAEIALLHRLRYIGVVATGYNIIDVASARSRGIVVTNVPTYGTNSVAQFVFALLLELCHNLSGHVQLARSGEWSRSRSWSLYHGPLVELAGTTLGIVGFGRIGRRTAQIADAFGMHVVATARHRLSASQLNSFRWAEMDSLLSESDVVSLHVPLVRETAGMINKDRLSRMKPTAFLINTSRGGLVVERDLAEALNEGRLAGAALDVLGEEPPASDNPLLSAKNCIVTPHIAWATRQARSRLMSIAVDNVAAFINGRPKNVVA